MDYGTPWMNGRQRQENVDINKWEILEVIQAK